MRPRALPSGPRGGVYVTDAGRLQCQSCGGTLKVCDPIGSCRYFCKRCRIHTVIPLVGVREPVEFVPPNPVGSIYQFRPDRAISIGPLSLRWG